MAGERTLWVHVGMPKTGTTSIQATLHAARDVLRRNGLVYPRAASAAKDSHHDLMALFHREGTGHRTFAKFGVPPARATADARRIWANVEAERDFAGDVLLSSEFFRRSGTTSVQRLDAAARDAGRTLRLVCYVRHPRAQVHSSAQQQIRSGTKTVRQALEEPHIRRNARFLGELIAAVGRERIVLRSFERAVAGPGITHDLLDCVGYRGDAGEIVELRRNESYSMIGTILAGAYHELVPDGGARGLPDGLSRIGGPPFRLPPEAVALSRDALDAETAFLRDELGVDIPEHRERPRQAAFGVLDERAARDLVALLLAEDRSLRRRMGRARARGRGLLRGFGIGA